MDEDDEFLYGESAAAEEPSTTSEPKPLSYETIETSNGIVAHLEKEAEKAASSKATSEERQDEAEEDEAFEEEDDSEEEDDIEIIMEPVARSLDFRSQNRQSTSRPTQPATPQAPKPAQPSLLTEYTPIQRGGPPPSTATPSQAPQAAETAAATPSKPVQQQQPQQPAKQEAEIVPDDGVDPNTLPAVTAPPSHPVVDPSATAIIDGRSILELDINALADKPWRRPGSDISDWFNYGFDELSWEAYCYRRRDLGEMATVLKTNVINFSAMPEDQLVALPPEVRTMVMTGANAMMNNAANPNMMGANVMMDMGMMGPMGMGMNGDMGMGNPMMQGMMGGGGGPEGGQGQQAGVGANGTPEQAMMQEGFNPNGGGMMNMGMPGGEYGMADQSQMYPQAAMEQQQHQNVPSAQTVSSGRGGAASAAPFRGGRGAAGRGRGFPARGRGRGGIYGGDAPPAPVRPASPLPPGVPTGPRNQNKYKDRDGNAPAVDGLDYGGGKDAMARRTPSEQPEERISSSRKRRSSPGLDDVRSSKRR